MPASKKLKCVWRIDDLCEGEVKKHKLFYDKKTQKYTTKEIGIPICERHYELHKMIFSLASNGYDIEDIMREISKSADSDKKNYDWIKKQFLILKLSGILKPDEINE